MTMLHDEMVNVLLLARSKPEISDADFRKLCEAVLDLAVADGMTRGLRAINAARTAVEAIARAAA